MASFSGYCEVCGRRASDGIANIDGSLLVCTTCAMEEKVQVGQLSTNRASSSIEGEYRGTLSWYGLTGVHPGTPVLR